MRTLGDIDVAVVIVSYKSAALITNCLSSIQAERTSGELPIRVIVVDNASGDFPHIARAVEEHEWSSWVTMVLAPKNGGFAYGNNLGIRAAYECRRPSYVLLLNPDTEVRPGAIGGLVKFLEANPTVGIAGSSFETENGSEWPFAFRFPSVFSEIDYAVQLGLLTRCLARWTVVKTMDRVAQSADWICGACMMIRPEVFSAIGCLDENFFLYFEETELCHRARLAGFSTWYVPQSRVMHIIGKSTNVDEATRPSRRLPGYWFDSRMRYFAITRGAFSAALIDLIAMACALVGWLRGRFSRHPSAPHYARDLFDHSILLRRNRPLPPLKSYFPP